MGYKSKLVRLLDHPGGRLILGGIATVAARRISPLDVKIAFVDGRWTRRVGAHFVPYGPNFPYISENFQEWRAQTEQYSSQTRDYWFTFYEPQEGDTIIDVGAGQGEDTLTFSRAVGKTGHVIAIEACPLSFKALEVFCRRNRLRNVTPIHMALMDKPGSVHITQAHIWTENTVLNDGNDHPTVIVPAGTLDGLCDQLGTGEISFIKMNIEGAERFALPGAAETMPRIHHVCVASHDFRADWGHGEQFRTRAFVERFLVGHGFTVASRTDDPREYVRDHIYGLRSS
jgi:FkbM family methyltransferase